MDVASPGRGDDVSHQEHSGPAHVVEPQQVLGDRCVGPVGFQVTAEIVELVDDARGAEGGAGGQEVVAYLHSGVEVASADVDLAQHDIPVRHFVLHADQDTLRTRIANDTVLGPNSPFRLHYLEPYAEAARTWLHAEAEVVDTTHLTPAQAAQLIAEAVKN
ncbi:hypothetical protein ACIPW5_29515 [Streptomyces sp. NPDC090077]|uniref:hypothetical protein n=1 Tax=Streptomyces sp. NPDC090077 TaxID=3365938 RepID=UPI0038307982